MSAESINDLLLAAISKASDFKVDYHALALEIGTSNANNAQKKFKAAVEKTGQYQLLNGHVVRLGSGPIAGPATPTANSAASTPASSAKKRKATSNSASKTSKRQATTSKGSSKITTFSDLKKNKTTESKDQPADEKDGDWADHEGDTDADQDDGEEA